MTREQISTAVQSVIDGIANPLEVLGIFKKLQKTKYLLTAKKEVLKYVR
jgi:hypothetical protein